MSAYLIAEITIHDPVTYERYRELAPASIALFGGHYIVRGGTTETLEGNWKSQRLVILEFPSSQHIRDWWSCAEYAPAKALRQASATTQMLLVEGVPGAAPAVTAGEVAR